jgi:hypothetical protein
MENVRIIDNRDEYSRSIERPNHTRLDICAFRKERELVIAIVDENEKHVEEIAFSPEELEILKQHISDPVTLAILGGEK